MEIYIPNLFTYGKAIAQPYPPIIKKPYTNIHVFILTSDYHIYLAHSYRNMEKIMQKTTSDKKKNTQQRASRG